jgi:phosphoribosyl 1,2-cyclic phosphate phosphodiesterase
LRVTFLGTGTSQGVPVIGCNCEVCISADWHDKRLRSSIMIDVNGKRFVIDTGPDFRQQMLREKVRNVDALLFTHEHKDHTAGLDDIRAFNHIKQMPMDIYAEERVQISLRAEFPYIFVKDRYPGVPKVQFHTINNTAFSIEGVNVIPIRTMHHLLPIFGFRIGDFTYITDSNFISDEEKLKIKGTKYLAVTGLRKEKHLSHFSLSEALNFIAEMKPEKGYITHCSHQLGIHSVLEKELPENVHIAYDGLVLDL